MSQSPYDLSSRPNPLTAPLKEQPSKRGNVSNVSHATVTETAILRSQVKDLKDRLDALEATVTALAEQNGALTRQVQALREGAVLDEEP